MLLSWGLPTLGTGKWDLMTLMRRWLTVRSYTAAESLYREGYWQHALERRLCIFTVKCVGPMTGSYLSRRVKDWECLNDHSVPSSEGNVKISLLVEVFPFRLCNIHYCRSSSSHSLSFLVFISFQLSAIQWKSLCIIPDDILLPYSSFLPFPNLQLFPPLLVSVFPLYFVPCVSI